MIIIIIRRRPLLYICICNAITERQVRESARSGASSLDDLSFMLGVGAGCGRCRECAEELLRNARVEEEVQPELSPAAP